MFVVRGQVLVAPGEPGGGGPPVELFFSSHSKRERTRWIDAINEALEARANAAVANASRAVTSGGGESDESDGADNGGLKALSAHAVVPGRIPGGDDDGTEGSGGDGDEGRKRQRRRKRLVKSSSAAGGLMSGRTTFRSSRDTSRRGRTTASRSKEGLSSHAAERRLSESPPIGHGSGGNSGRSNGTDPSPLATPKGHLPSTSMPSSQPPSDDRYGDGDRQSRGPDDRILTP